MGRSSNTFRPALKAAVVLVLAAVLVIIVSNRHRFSGDQKRITASEVVDRESLQAFVTGAKDHLFSLRNVGQFAQLRESLRTEGDWKSDSLFLMFLTPDGNVMLHGNDPTAENKNISAVEDDQGKKVVQELLAAAEQGGGFVEYHWDDPDQPDDEIRKVSYAIDITAPRSGQKVVMVGGYAQDLSHVPVEVPDLPRPAVTAAEVVDRETLTTFVEEAATAFRAAYLTENFSGVSAVKNAFRAEGDWKSGSVYVWVVSDEGYVVFHGSEQHREGKRSNLNREDINGIQFVRELIATGAAGGGYVEYNYDNPAVEGDEDTGSPKVGYATSFTLPGRDDHPFVVGSGIYYGSDI